jgi:hypothetical protein
MTRSFPLQELGGDLPQLDLNCLEEPFARTFIALAPESKPSCDLIRIRHSLPGRKMIRVTSSFRYYKCCDKGGSRAAGVEASEQRR